MLCEATGLSKAWNADEGENMWWVVEKAASRFGVEVWLSKSLYPTGFNA